MLVAIGVMGTLDSIWGLAIAGVAMLATGLVTARAGVLGAGALLFWMGIAVIVIDRAGSPVVVAAGLLVAAAAVVAIGIGLASARRRAALEARLEPPWRRR